MNPKDSQPRPKYDVIREADWARHPVLSQLQRGTDVWPNEWHFYFAGFTPQQTRNLKRIELASAPKGSLHFTLVEKIRGSADALFEEAANVRWYLGDPMGGAREWVALVPRGFDLDADVHSVIDEESPSIVTDLRAGTLSEQDRRDFLRYLGYDDDNISLALGSLAWSDAQILHGIAGLTKR
ncbi:MAG: hypothetical protein JWQ68_2371 [Cryobacterium sp.]|jgi:hypothetical protein|nr:hypothetical protein [Cryobacterium sp.]